MTLLQKFLDAGLPIQNATEDGAITGIPGVSMTTEQFQTFQDVIEKHFRPTEYARKEAIKQKKANARNKLYLANSFVSMTTDEVLAHIDENSGNVPAMREEVKKLAILILALRDEVMSDL